MQTLLLTVVLLGLVAVLQAQDPLPFRPKDPDFSGIWYLKAMVDNRNASEELKPTEMSPVLVTDASTGKLNAWNVKLSYLITGRCYRDKVLIIKATKPGEYFLWRGTLTCGEELPVKDHYLCYTEVPLFRELLRVGYLVGRTPEQSPEALEEFKKFTRHKGLPQEDILIPEQTETCISEQD